MSRRTTETQIEAFEDIKAELGERQAKVLSVLQVDSNLTAREIASLVGREVHQTTPRIRELSDKGIVKQAGKKVCQYTKRMVTSYRKATKAEVENFQKPEDAANIRMHMGVSFNPSNKQWVVYFEGKIIGTAPGYKSAGKLLKKAYLTKIRG